MPHFQSANLRTLVSGSSGFGGGGRSGATVQFVISGPSLDKLEEISKKALIEFKKIDGVVDADTSLEFGKPELQVTVDRDLASQLGVVPTDVSDALRYFERASVINARRDVTTAVTSLNSAQAALRTAQANLSNIPVTRQDTRISYEAVRQAQATLAKTKANRADVPVAREDIEAARANVRQAEETLKQAQINWDYARIVSPVDGVVNTKSAAPGQASTVGGTLLNLVAVNSVYFEAQIDEDSVSDVKVGMPVQVSAASVSDKPLSGFVADVIRIADSSSRQFRIRVSLPNAIRGLTPGAFARGQIVLKAAPKALLVPDDAIRQDGGQKMVLTVVGTGETAKTEKHLVSTGMSANGKTQILGGLQSGERVVVGNPLLKAGTTIRVNASETYSM